jgi:ATP-dependent helicase/nuclease subunit A
VDKLTVNQKRAIETLDKNILVSAGAGSGKTHVLVERFIEMLRKNEDFKIANMMAVTFTRKAAAEMRTRLKRRFLELFKKTEGLEKERWAKCLAEIDGARIGTIHSLSESILKSFAVEAGIDPHFEQLDDVERSELYVSAVEEVLRQVIAEKTAEHDLLITISIDELKELLKKILEAAPRFLEATKEFAQFDQEQFLSALSKSLRRAQTTLVNDLLSSSAWHEAIDTIRSHPRVFNALDEFTEELLARVDQAHANWQDYQTYGRAESLQSCWAALLLIAETTARNKGGNSEEAKELRANLKVPTELTRDYLRRSNYKFPTAIDEAAGENWEQLKLFLSLAQKVLDLYEAKKRDTNRLDYNDLIALASKALAEEDSPIKDYYHDANWQILVDEFQDTNRAQSKMIAALAGAKTRLFLIGDDKQSIYKFQGADVSTFNEWRTRFDSANGEEGPDHLSEVLELNDSFRSHPKIVSFFNAVFEQLLKDEASSASYRAKYRALKSPEKPAREELEIVESEPVEVIIVDPMTPDENGEIQDYRMVEPTQIARWIIERVENENYFVDKNGKRKRINYGDIAILLQKNSQFRNIELALTRQDIPYVRMAGQGFLNRQEVLDLESVLDFLDNPNNSHALLAVIRSPIFSISDDLIHRIYTDQRDTLWSVLKKEADNRKEGYELIASCVHRLRKLLADASVQTLSELLKNIIQKSSYDLTLIGAPEGKQRSRNLWKVVQLASARDHLSPGEFGRYLKSMRTLGVDQKDAPLDAPNSVRLMTIHSSKGLEFPVVILPALNSSIHGFTNKVLFHREYGFAFNNAKSKDDVSPLSYTLAKFLEEDMEDAEMRRLLYVAMTRARDNLAIFLNIKSRGETFFNWLQPLLLQDLSDSPLVDGVKFVKHSSASFKLRFGIPKQEKPVSFEVKNEETALANLLAKDTLASITQPTQQLSIFSLVEEQHAPSHSKESNLARITQSTIDTTLIEPIDSEPIEPPAVWLEAARITPRGGQVELHSILVGKYFHALMEHIEAGQNFVSREVLENLALEQREFTAHQAIHQKLVTEGRSLLEKYFASELFTMIATSKTRLCEHPYYKLGESTLETKRPDLILETSDSNWLIIDYKTDYFDLEQIERHSAEHRKQLTAYVEDFQQLTKIKAEPFLYFAQYGRLHPIKTIPPRNLPVQIDFESETSITILTADY